METERKQSACYMRYAGTYFFYFASLGALIPYWSLYLKHLEFTPAQIGELSAILLATKIIAPNVWGWIADYTGKRICIIRLAAFASMSIFAAVLVVRDYWSLLLVLAGFSFFWNAALPQFEVETMNHLGTGKHLYSRIRLWGSVGFIVVASLLAPLLQRWGIELLPWMILVLLACIWVNTLLVRGSINGKADHEKASLLKTCSHPPVIALLVACFLTQVSHGPHYAFFSIYLEGYEYSHATIGQLWSLGVIAEIAVFFWMYRWLPKYGAKILLMAAMLLTILRWWLIAVFADYLPLLLFAQLLHAASFGLFHASAIHLIDQYFPGSIQGRGQALYSSIGFGLGGSLGSLMSGYTWDLIGPSHVYLLAMGIVSLALIQFVWIAKPRLTDILIRDGK